MTERRPRTDLIDGLRRFQDEFERDFQIRDIQPHLKEHINRNVLMDITQLPTEEHRIEKLFFHFIYVKKDVTPLLQCLQRAYRWLYDKIAKSSGDKWISDYRRAIQDIPNNQDWNVHRIQYLWEIQQHLKNLKRNHFLILFGKSGFGKRWLAA